MTVIRFKKEVAGIKFDMDHAHKRICIVKFAVTVVIQQILPYPASILGHPASISEFFWTYLDHKIFWKRVFYLEKSSI